MRPFFLLAPLDVLALALSTQEINLSISKFTVAEHNKCSVAAPYLCSALLELQVLLFPAAFQCAGLARGSNKGGGRSRGAGATLSMNPSNQP